MIAEGGQLVRKILYMQNSIFMLTVYSLAYFYHWKSPQSLPHLLHNVNKTWGHFLALPCSQFVAPITFERPLHLCFAINRKWLLELFKRNCDIFSFIWYNLLVQKRTYLFWPGHCFLVGINVLFPSINLFFLDFFLSCLYKVFQHAQASFRRKTTFMATRQSFRHLLQHRPPMDKANGSHTQSQPRKDKKVNVCMVCSRQSRSPLQSLYDRSQRVHKNYKILFVAPHMLIGKHFL